MEQLQKNESTPVRILGALLLTVSVVFSNSSLGDQPVICYEEAGYVVDNSKITLLDLDCEELESDKHNFCGVLVSAPMDVDGREFLSFTFGIAESGDPLLQLNLGTVANNELVEASFYGVREMIRNVEVHAVYEVKESCSLRAILKFDDKL